jgi:polysaccharide biosynthesis protein PslH
MRTLFVANTLPFPLTAGGHQRIYHLLRAVAAVSDVTLVCPTPGGQWCAELEELRPFYERAVPFPLESFDCQRQLTGRSAFHSLARVARNYGHPTEPAVLRWYRSAPATRLLASLGHDGYDLIWAERLIGMNLLPPRVTSHVIVDLDDLLHRKLAQKLRRSGLDWAWPLDASEFLKLRRLEHRLPRRPYEFVVCSERDRQVLGGGPRVSVVPNGVDLPPAPPLSVADPGATFVFVGMMATEANIDAVCFFATEILPLVQRELPDARLVIAGSQPDRRVRKLHDGKTIMVTGTVPSVTPYLRSATAMVVPIRFGSGTRIKILEAMAHHLPVISTTAGAEGLEVVPARHLVIADTPPQFAAACLRLWRDASLRHRLATWGFDLVRSQYTWSAIEAQVEALVLSRGAVQPLGVEP